ncbi:hypothetical protein BGW36DRAFT_294939 [Talaromyces proteolyticus]|uniref:Zn(2)-C6 fungal-type domain-containing protein n=1 Tax=Talaromyces proteolyticus TaxID=1131652 RepID=A0AAD4KVK5_9EURO|nr:uncharacterized protein BGW36DRAFT_294939 [Talaromyces proteolyticus]KAH8699264.1 hypothetical protein BGW36DRAFT_294939 [Talaromyces proteolyticus]
MPRPKVRPEDRQRSSKACLPCQASKIRCDSQSPCMSCMRRDRASTCSYNETSRRRSHGHVRDRPRPVRFVSRKTTRSTTSSGPSSAPPRQSTPINTVDCNDDSHAKLFRGNSPQSGPVLDSPQCTESRLLLSSKGEKVYVGETSALSFLQFLRGIMKKYIGPSAFTENGRVNFMLEADTNEDQEVALEESLEEKEDLIQTFFEASSGFLDLFDQTDILRILQTEDSSQKRRLSKEELGILYLVIAIGGQCRGLNSMDSHYAVKYFSKGQQLAFDGMLRDPSINMVRIFLLMTFYMLGACHRNAAYMYLGVASKAAATLGLHISKQYQGLSENEHLLRWRVYKSLRVFDILVSTPLGRPVSSLPLDYDELLLQNRIHTQSMTAVSAAFSGSAILEDIVQKLRATGNNFDSPTAEQFLHRLRQWTNSLPLKFRQLAADYDTVAVIRETAIGSVHISCIYYFAIILTTRSFLILHLMARLKELSILASSPVNNPTLQSEPDMKTSRLANVCIQAGAYMANMCEKAMLSGLLLKNMCIVKAWVFAAGLVLGFSLFAYDDTESRRDTEASFQSARHVLRNLANLSPQAKHYDEILTSFAEAIINHRQQILSHRQKVTSKFIDCILDIDIAPTDRLIYQFEDNNNDVTEYCYSDYDKTSQALPGTAALDSGSVELASSDDIGDVGVDLDGFSGFSFQDGGNWSIDYEPFGLLFDGM